MANPPDDGPCEVTITAPNRDWLNNFVRELVESRLAAAGHVDSMHTTYRWKGQVQSSEEARAVLHTMSTNLPEIVSRTKNLHPFRVPCITATSIIDGNEDYLLWIWSGGEAEWDSQG